MMAHRIDVFALQEIVIASAVPNPMPTVAAFPPCPAVFVLSCCVAFPAPGYTRVTHCLSTFTNALLRTAIS